MLKATQKEQDPQVINQQILNQTAINKPYIGLPSAVNKEFALNIPNGDTWKVIFVPDLIALQFQAKSYGVYDVLRDEILAIAVKEDALNPALKRVVKP